MLPPNFLDAIRSLRPASSFSVTEDRVVTWKDADTTAPSNAEIEAELIRLQEDWSDNQYQRDRAADYPSIGDQLDMQYHDLIDGTTTWKDAVASVKTAHPKG